VSVTFNLFRIRRFPQAPREGVIIFEKVETHLGGGRPAQTLVNFKSKKPKSGLEFYISRHEMLKRVEGRLYDGTEFNEFFKKNEVTLVLRRQVSLLLCKSSSVVARNLIDELNEEYPVSFRADYLQIDFERIRHKRVNIRTGRTVRTDRTCPTCRTGHAG
jgi:hypothetical protein